MLKRSPKDRQMHLHSSLRRGIADPWYTDDFGAAYADIVRGCAAFLEHLRRSGAV